MIGLEEEGGSRGDAKFEEVEQEFQSSLEVDRSPRSVCLAAHLRSAPTQGS